MIYRKRSENNSKQVGAAITPIRRIVSAASPTRI